MAALAQYPGQATFRPSVLVFCAPLHRNRHLVFELHNTTAQAIFWTVAGTTFPLLFTQLGGLLAAGETVTVGVSLLVWPFADRGASLAGLIVFRWRNIPVHGPVVPLLAHHRYYQMAVVFMG